MAGYLSDKLLHCYDSIHSDLPYIICVLVINGDDIAFDLSFKCHRSLYFFLQTLFLRHKATSLQFDACIYHLNPFPCLLGFKLTDDLPYVLLIGLSDNSTHAFLFDEILWLR